MESIFDGPFGLVWTETDLSTEQLIETSSGLVFVVSGLALSYMYLVFRFLLSLILSKEVRDCFRGQSNRDEKEIEGEKEQG